VLSFWTLKAQNLPTACANGTERYGITPLAGSTVVWSVIGGSIVNDYNDSIDVLWNNVSGIQTISYKEINLYGCEGPSTYAYIMLSKPELSLSSADICSGNSASLTAPEGYFSYRWSDSTTLKYFVTSIEGKYWLDVKDSVGCSASDTFNVYIHAKPDVHLVNPLNPLCSPNTYTYSLDLPNNETYNYEWFNGSSMSSYEAHEGDTVVWVVVTNSYGCSGSDSAYVPLCDVASKIPNAFTPGGGDQNEVWRLDVIRFSYPNLVVKIYDRWGRLVFTSTRGYTAPWDGTSRGKDLPMDTYYYVIDLGNGAKDIVGSVAIIR